ncbi:MAG: tetratricopeptide repeat protein [Phycisphaerales bacterium]|nr:tetratricopeptide repeat protein [Phycisphaerales bacterium]
MPDLAAKFHQAKHLYDTGRLDEARGALEKLIRLEPRHAQAHGLLSHLLLMRSQPREALRLARKAFELAPRDPECAANLGHTLRELGQFEESERVLRVCVGLAPAYVPGVTELAETLGRQHRLIEADEVMGRAASLVGDDLFRDSKAAQIYAYLQLDLGRTEKSLALIERAASVSPADRHILFARASITNYAVGDDPERVFTNHRAWGRVLEERMPLARWAPGGVTVKPAPKAPGEKLRVGVLSPDLRRHSVGFFAEPMLQHLPRDRFELIVYFSNGEAADDFSKRMSEYPGLRWTSIRQATPKALAERIRQDRVDLLIELAGLTANNSILTAAMMPAAATATCIGYAATLGLSRVGYRIVDSLTDPPEADRWATETLVRIDPVFLCYRPPEEALAAGVGPPAFERDDAGGAVTFASFNHWRKTGQRLLELWARVLKAAPGSRLMLKNSSMTHEGERRAMKQRFEDAGIPEDRLVPMPWAANNADHFRAYHRVDIGLDTYPYHGTTTTCEAMLMGVPVVTLAGRTHASRVGISLVSAAGLPELAARDEDDYVRIAAELAGDRARLRAIRGSLRERLLSGPLCDGPAYGARLGAAIESIWADACAKAAGGPP